MYIKLMEENKIELNTSVTIYANNKHNQVKTCDKK